MRLTDTNAAGVNEHSDDIPQHVAIVMDGNGRWARKRRLPRHAGHRSGVKTVRSIVELAAQRGISYLTLFAFSSENWSRPEAEVSKLMQLFLEAVQREAASLHRNKVKLTFIGAREQLQPGLVTKISEAEALTAGNDGLSLIVAVAYGGRWDIVNAAKSLAVQVEQDRLAAEAIDENVFSRELQLADIPDVDLLIRTGGEQRISNFLLWNIAYAELYFTDRLWPDFAAADFDAAIAHFAGRQRRYGHTGDQIGAV
jgi:undecaprenyl diphosphate synthase